MVANIKNIAEQSSAWPFREANKLLKFFNNNTPKKGYILFETGYGPSGLPHIGTFGEVARTTMVKNAFNKISSIPSKLIAFSDDMDGLRKVPENVPNKNLLEQYIDKPLTRVPDPFEKYASFAEHNNENLKQFLNQFNFEYDFVSSTKCYLNGIFDSTLLKILNNYDKIMEIILPTLGKERRATYSPFLPICEQSGKVLQVPVININTDNGTIKYKREDGKSVVTKVTKGKCKLQWKADWAMRWVALDVNYEMNGKDLIPSYELSKRIVNSIGHKAPINMTYELFLDENGEKISKSKGNGLSLQDWLAYGTEESLSLYMFQNPQRAKKLYFNVIPKHVDEYTRFLNSANDQEMESLLKNPIWHIHNGNFPKLSNPISYSMILNLASVCNATSPEILKGFIYKYLKNYKKEDSYLDTLITKALKYYNDFIHPYKQYKKPNEKEIIALKELVERLSNIKDNTDDQSIQYEIYETGKSNNYKNLKEWFVSLYEILLGQKEGPRMGTFIAIYGCNETIDLIHTAIEGKLIKD